jgi:hypothetical protein
MAAPVTTAFEMSTEPCRAWAQANGNKPLHTLATYLVSRLEVFCMRLAASASGTGSRSRLLVTGWTPKARHAPPDAHEAPVIALTHDVGRLSLAHAMLIAARSAAHLHRRPHRALVQVQTMAFVKRGFMFQGAANATLGYKMLKNDAAQKPGAVKRDADAADSPAGASDAADADAAAGTSRVADDGEASHSRVDAAGTTPATAVGAAAKRRKAEEEEGGEATPLGGTGGAPPTSAAGAGAAGENAAVDAAMAAAGLGGVDGSVDGAASGGVKVEAIELGELSQIGRVAPASARDEGAADEVYVPVTNKYVDEGMGVALGGGTAEGEEPDELDATMAELLG